RCGGVRIAAVTHDAHEALDVYAQASKSPASDPVSAHRIAMAQLALADAGFEAFYAAPGADAAATLVARYEKILAHTRDPNAAVAVAARLAEIAVATWRDAGDCTASSPRAAKALAAYKVCIDKASQLGIAEWSARCYAGASAIDPVTFLPPEVVPELGA